jgi:hypothetical protein
MENILNTELKNRFVTDWAQPVPMTLEDRAKLFKQTSSREELEMRS